MNEMKKVFRISLDIPFVQHEIELPHDAKVVHFGEDVYGGLSFWYEFDPDIDYVETRIFHVVDTNMAVGISSEYRGTCNHGGLTYHLYETYL